MGKCKDCKFYYPECIYMEGDSKEWQKWGECQHPKLNINGDIINAGGEDGCGDYWRMTQEFGCILFEPKQG